MKHILWVKRTDLDSLTPTERILVKEYLFAKSNGKVREFKKRVIAKYGYCKCIQIIGSTKNRYCDD